MDKDQNQTNGAAQNENKKQLALPTQIAFIAAICFLPFLNSLVGGFLGAFISIIASAMNILLALEFSASKPKLTLVLLLNIVPFVGAYIYFENLAAALITLYPLALALPIFITVRIGLGRTASIACAAICCFALFLSSFVIVIAEQYGAVNIETASSFIDSVFSPMAEQFKNLLKEQGGEELQSITPQMIDMLIYYTKTVLIGTIAAAMIVFAYLATLATRLLANAFGVLDRLPLGLRVRVRAVMGADGPNVEVSQETVAWRIEIDSVTVGVYIAAYIASVLLASDGTKMSILYIALQNLVMILSPGFFYCGVRDIALGFKLKTHKSTFRTILLIFGIVFLFIMPNVPIMIMCALGVIVVIRENRARKHLIKNRKE